MINLSGLYLDVDPDAYHSDELPTPSLNQSLIPTLLKKSAYHAAFEHPRLNPYGSARESSRAQWLGEAVHRLALGRGRQISEIRWPDYSSASAREARDEAMRNKRIPVLTRDLIRSRDMALILRDTIEQEFCHEEYFTEVMLCWEEETPSGLIWCRSLIDAYCPSRAYALDPKVLRTPATAEAFGANAAKSGYDIQDAFIRRGLGRVLPDLEGRLRFSNLVMESAAPHGHSVFEPDGPSRAAAELQVQDAINIWGRCLHSRTWPSYPAGRRPYSTPAWYQQQLLTEAFTAQ